MKINKALLVRLLEREQVHQQNEVVRWAVLRARSTRLKQLDLAHTCATNVELCNQLAQECVVNIAAIGRLP